MLTNLERIRNGKTFKIPEDFKIHSQFAKEGKGVFTVLTNGTDHVMSKQLGPSAVMIPHGDLTYSAQIGQQFDNVQRFLGADPSSTNQNTNLHYDCSNDILKSLHDEHRSNRQYIPETLIWKVFTDINAAGQQLEAKGWFHPHISLDNIFLRNGQFVLSNPMIDDSFISEFVKIEKSASNVKQECLQTHQNENVTELGYCLLQLSSLARPSDLYSLDTKLMNKPNVRKSLKISHMLYSEPLNQLIEVLIKGRAHNKDLTFTSLNRQLKGVKEKDQGAQPQDQRAKENTQKFSSVGNELAGGQQMANQGIFFR
jgi:hypothetical protein